MGRALRCRGRIRAVSCNGLGAWRVNGSGFSLKLHVKVSEARNSKGAVIRECVGVLRHLVAWLVVFEHGWKEDFVREYHVNSTARLDARDLYPRPVVLDNLKDLYDARGL